MATILGCEQPVVEPVVAPSFARGGNPGKPGGGDDPPPPADEGRVWVVVGYPAVINQAIPEGAVSGVQRRTRPVGEVVDIELVMDVEYLAALAGFDPCFPDDLVKGEIALTEASGVGGADFSFSALAVDGVTGVQYALTLHGGAFVGAWPAPSGTTSAFHADTWTLATTGGKGRKRQGCTGAGTFPDAVRVEMRHQGPVVVDATAAFLSAPFEEDRNVTNLFDHTGTGDGLVVDFRGDTVPGRDGHAAYAWVMPEGEEIAAAADGVVAWSGLQWPFFCSAIGRIVDDQIFVAVDHVGPSGQAFTTGYFPEPNTG